MFTFGREGERPSDIVREQSEFVVCDRGKRRRASGGGNDERTKVTERRTGSLVCGRQVCVLQYVQYDKIKF